MNNYYNPNNPPIKHSQMYDKRNVIDDNYFQQHNIQNTSNKDLSSNEYVTFNSATRQTIQREQKSLSYNEHQYQTTQKHKTADLRSSKLYQKLGQQSTFDAMDSKFSIDHNTENDIFNVNLQAQMDNRKDVKQDKNYFIRESISTYTLSQLAVITQLLHTDTKNDDQFLQKIDDFIDDRKLIIPNWIQNAIHTLGQTNTDSGLIVTESLYSTCSSILLHVLLHARNLDPLDVDSNFDGDFINHLDNMQNIEKGTTFLFNTNSCKDKLKKYAINEYKTQYLGKPVMFRIQMGNRLQEVNTEFQDLGNLQLLQFYATAPFVQPSAAIERVQELAMIISLLNHDDWFERIQAQDNVIQWIHRLWKFRLSNLHLQSEVFGQMLKKALNEIIARSEAFKIRQKDELTPSGKFQPTTKGQISQLIVKEGESFSAPVFVNKQQTITGLVYDFTKRVFEEKRYYEVYVNRDRDKLLREYLKAAMFDEKIT